MPASRSRNTRHTSSNLLTVALLLAIAAGAAAAQTAPASDIAADAIAADLARLVQVYPDHLRGIDGNMLVWKDGARMPIDEGRGARDHETLLATADIKDMFFAPYPLGRPSGPPGRNADPGRARNAAFFNKMYGDCKADGVTRNLVDVRWLPTKWGRTVKASRINGVAGRLAKISSELDALPARFDAFLFPSAGTYNCRPIAGTSQMSAHSHGIAIDIATKRAHYWRWSGGKPGGEIPYRNAIPFEIVAIFEKHGFIWGGKWYHYDTMHFEYRPELMPPAR
jgi:D-alanyl-D-alanine carboxypeptidase-like protein